MRKVSQGPKFIYFQGQKKAAKKINAYLIDGGDVIVRKRTTPLSELPKMTSGNKPLDGGNLILNTAEKEDLLDSFPSSQVLVRKFIGSSDFIRGNERWCLWIRDEDLQLANSIPPIKKRIDAVRDFRLGGGSNARNKADVPHRFEFANEPRTTQIIIPRHSSTRRTYIPMGFMKADEVVADSAQVIFDPEPHVLAIASSLLHMCWVRITSGRLKTDFRYSSYYSYYTFPIPRVPETVRSELEERVFGVFDERESFPEMTLSQLYDPDTMPDSLREAHHQMDLAVERCYRKKPFSSDEERLEYLFKLYEIMIEEEKNTSA